MYPMGIRFNFNEDPAEVQTAPYFPVLHRAVIARAASAAERTVIPVPCTGTGLDPEVNDTILIRVEIVGFYNGILDIEQFLHNVLDEAILSLSCIVDVWTLILYRGPGGFFNM